jgi:hypothetical protein
MDVKEGIIVGLGEVGSSWFKVLSENSDLNITGIDIRGDKERKKDKKEEGKTVMHVCIPFLDTFEEIASGYIKEYNPDLVIVNTSCKVGSTRNLYNLTKAPMVHTPVRGLHPNIDKGIKTFVNAIGPINELSGKLAEDYLDSLGIRHKTFNNPEETEMAKLLDTSYYGWNILFAKQVLYLCQEYGLDFENVYTEFNKTYNEGYMQLGKKDVSRPVLIPPQVFNRNLGVGDSRINGHCVRTNLEILKTMKRSERVRFIDYAIELDDK